MFELSYDFRYRTMGSADCQIMLHGSCVLSVHHKLQRHSGVSQALDFRWPFSKNCAITSQSALFTCRWLIKQANLTMVTHIWHN
uniref:Uncharacterized protein n=1 Tax=Anguilla anguilla TaxID=7936 RepID=A0A0E9UHA1_ANGAN